MSLEERRGQRAAGEEGEGGAGGFGSLPPSRDGPRTPLAKVPEGASLVLRFRGFYLPVDVSLPFIPFDFRAGFFESCVQKTTNLGVKRAPFRPCSADVASSSTFPLPHALAGVGSLRIAHGPERARGWGL